MDIYDSIHVPPPRKMSVLVDEMPESIDLMASEIELHLRKSVHHIIFFYHSYRAHISVDIAVTHMVVDACRKAISVEKLDFPYGMAQCMYRQLSYRLLACFSHLTK